MSALEPTKKEMQDLVVVILPRVIVEAMNNPQGEFYNDEITNKAFIKALEMDQYYAKSKNFKRRTAGVGVF